MLKALNWRLQARRGFATAWAKPFQVAIDGPAASGKSTTAKMVAQRLGFQYIDTGAFYRCITYEVLSREIDPTDPRNEEQISSIAEQAHIRLQTLFAAASGASKDQDRILHSLPTTRVFLEEQDVSSQIRTEHVSQHVSAVAAIGGVRQAVLQKVRSIGAQDDARYVDGSPASKSSTEGLVMDGRDIGTVVLPHADLKVFLVADSRVRAERRLLELVKSGATPAQEKLDIDAVQRDLERRDELDRTRKVSPLMKAKDAMELDTSGLTIETQVDVIVQEVYRRRKSAA
ncbi:hypothetical protein BGZ98_005747 [Dissophora globulifera]|nr:hypothetical protein BGZ98_005747 [Dissophora globulifera]